MFAFALLVGQFLIIAGGDICRRKIPNAQIIALLATGMLLAALQASPLKITVSDALLSGFAAFMTLLPFYVFRLMGAGDVKLAAVLGICLGIKQIFIVWVLSSLLAMVFAFWSRSQFCVLFTPKLAADIGGRKFPYGAAMCFAAVVVLSQRLI